MNATTEDREVGPVEVEVQNLVRMQDSVPTTIERALITLAQRQDATNERLDRLMTALAAWYNPNA